MRILKIEEVFKDLPELNTQRLLLRKLRPEDAENIFEYASDPQVAKEVTWDAHRSPADSLEFVKFNLGKYERGEVADWGLVLKENNKLIGTIGFVWWRPAHAKAELGYAMSRTYWGRGLMPEAAKAVMDFGFGRMKLHRVEARCNVTNPASERVMMKCGMKYEGLLRGAIWEKGVFKDLKIYSILDSERKD